MQSVFEPQLNSYAAQPHSSEPYTTEPLFKEKLPINANLEIHLNSNSLLNSCYPFKVS